MTPVDLFVDIALRQAGDRYRFGVEVSEDDPDPAAFDCSELIQWAAARAGVSPRVPDGSWIQYRHVHNAGTEVSIPKALATRGALLFRFGSDPLAGGRPSSAHVAISLGDDRTMEARSTSLGVGIFGNASRRSWTHAGLIPGIDYAAHVPPEVEPDPAGRIPTLRRGASGTFVARAQGLLLAHRLPTDGLVDRTGRPDGIFGPKTETHVRTFQTRAGVTSDGIVGPGTWTALIYGGGR